MNENQKGWVKVFIKIAVAIALVILVYYSFLPIQQKIRYYNTFLQVGECLCPPGAYEGAFNLSDLK